MHVYVFVYVCARVQCGWECPWACGGQRLNLATLYHSPLRFWRQALSLALDGIHAAGWPASGFQESTVSAPSIMKARFPA